jgi:hypothetical protein
MNATGSNQTKIFHLERVSLESSRDDILAGSGATRQLSSHRHR